MICNREAVVDEVLKYVSLGWKPYPVQPPGKDGEWCSCQKGSDCPDPGKHPFHDLGGLKSACRDKRKLKTIFKSSEASVGLLCEKSFWVLDIDGEQGLQDLAKLEEENGELPKTPTAKTGSGGKHYYFAFDRRLKKNRSRIRGCSIDVKTTGGAVVAPPSLHASGNAYEWLVDPGEADLSDAPEWLIDFVTADDRPSGSESGSAFTVADSLDLATAEGAGEGERNDWLCRLVGSHLGRLGDTPDLLSLATAWGSRCDPPMKESEVSKTVANLVAKHLTNNPQEEDAIEEASSELSIRTFDQIEAKQVAWLWPGRFALGKITLLTGEGGVGKSMLTCDMASRISTGSAFTDVSTAMKGDSFFVAGEDGAEDTIRPRLDAAKADVSRVHLIAGPIPKGEKYATQFDLSRHLLKLDRLLEGYPEARMIVIDPIMDYLGATINSDKATDVRRVLSPLRQLAEKHEVAVVAMNHLNKSGKGSKNRSLGSGAFVQVARIELRVCEDPEDPERRLLLPVKNNLAAAPGLAFKIESASNQAGFAVWEEGEVETTIQQVEAADSDGESKSALSEAEDWLRCFLSEGDVKAAEAKKKSKADGISDRTLNRAKKTLKIETFQRDRCHWWKLPGGEENNPQEDSSQEGETEQTEFTF